MAAALGMTTTISARNDITCKRVIQTESHHQYLFSIGDGT